MIQTPSSRMDEFRFILPVFMITFLAQAEHLMIVPLSAEIASATGIPATRSGLLVSLYPVAAAISAFFLAPFSDRFGRKPMLLFLVLGFSLASFGCALADSPLTMYGFRILCGIFGGIILPNALAYISDCFTGAARIRGLATIMLTFPMASVLGVPIGAWLGDLISWRLPFFAIAIAAVVFSAFLIRRPSVSGETDKGIMRQYRELIALWERPDIRRLFLIQFFMLIGLFGFVPHISVWLSQNFQMSATQIGLCYMQGGLGAILGNFLARHLLQKNFVSSLIAAGSLLMGTTLFAFTLELFPANLIGLAFALTMFSGGLRMPALQVVLSDLVSVEYRGRLLAMSMIVTNATMGLGGFWSLPFLRLENHYLHGMEAIGWVSFLTLAVVPLLIYQFRRTYLGSPA